MILARISAFCLLIVCIYLYVTYFNNQSFWYSEIFVTLCHNRHGQKQCRQLPTDRQEALRSTKLPNISRNPTISHPLTSSHTITLIRYLFTILYLRGMHYTSKASRTYAHSWQPATKWDPCVIFFHVHKLDGQPGHCHQNIRLVAGLIAYESKEMIRPLFFQLDSSNFLINMYIFCDMNNSIKTEDSTKATLL